MKVDRSCAALLIALCTAGTLTACEKLEQDDRERNAQQISIEQLPLAVKSVVAKESEGGSAKEAETFIKDGKTLYGVTIARNGNEEELLVSETGEIVGRKAPGKKEDND
ncbi:MAG: hypothetical protein HY067_23130 [Betaproteobacteria bacterium]|nr:hypothetical protein [Betaproteobacteria bacterium]